MKNENYLSIKEASEFLNISKSTLITWEQKGLLSPYKTVGGHRRYKKEELLSVFKFHSCIPQPKSKVTIGYCRVSSVGQKDDLKRQVEVVTNFCEKNGYIFQIIEDIGSGLNDNRKGLLKTVQMICTDQCDRVVVNYKDRLARFGTGIIEEMCRMHNVELIVINQSEQLSYEKELVDDVLSVITEFSAKLYGQRSHKNKQIVEQNKALFTKDGDYHEGK